MKKFIAILLTGMISFAPVAFAEDNSANSDTNKQQIQKTSDCDCKCCKNHNHD